MHNPRKGKNLQRLLIAILLLVLGKFVTLYLFRGGHDLSAKRREYLASTIVQQGNNLRIAAQAMMANGAEIAAITFDRNDANGIFNPSLGLSRPEQVPEDAFADPAARHSWIKKDNVHLEMERTAVMDHVAVLVGLRKDICGEIDRLLRQNNDRSIPRTAVSSATMQAWQSVATPLDFSSDAKHATRSGPEGCMETSDGKYVYYTVMVST